MTGDFNKHPSDSTPALAARNQLVPVAISLIVVSLIWVFLSAMGMAYFYSAFSAPDADPDKRHISKIYILYMLISAAYSLLLISGAFSMLRQGSYVWAVTISCLALVPFLGPCYFLAIPIGIWALVVLRRPSVRDSFQRIA